MADYIERQAAIDAFNRIKNTLKNPETAHYDTLMFYEIEDVLEDVEPADVAPVVHGKWMKEDRGHVEYCAVCDQCGFDWMWSDRGYFKFCPNCGADMREVTT